MKLIRRLLAGLLSAALCAVCVPTAEAAPPETLPVKIEAKSAVLMEVGTGQVLLQMNERERLYPASVTKILPMLLVVEAIEAGQIALDDLVTVSAEAAGKGGSQIWLKEGEQMTVHDLLKATAVYSANDACTALGEYLAGSDAAFVQRLNERAAQLGMQDTHFENCTGLDDSAQDHKTSALDVAIMSRALLQHEMILDYTTIWMDSLRDGATALVNTNKLVRFYAGTTGLKTGTTAKAGCCISASAMRDGMHLIAVVMGSPNSAARFDAAKALLNWGFANYTTVTPQIDRSLIPAVGVLGGVTDRITPQLPVITPLPVEKSQSGKLTQTVDLAVDVHAPVEAGQVLGTVTVRAGETVLGVYKLTAPAAVEALSFGFVLHRLARRLMQLRAS
ncbi:MAG: D-alanyl-D-alanine carboxypeptidase [Clostridia bacterium]|nr:D-alanyl-D-alanine carboxypeptidase [Clostridia bacterium]